MQDLGEGDIELVNCRTCGRNFRPDVIRKHEPICIKNSKKKRKIFDSGKQRAEGSDIPINKVLKPGEIPKTDPKLAIAEARTKKWREKHEMLVESFRAARNYAKAKSSGGPLPPPPPAVIDPSLVQCPYCQRRFNEESSKRHIPFCKDQQSKILPRAGNAATKKTLYKAPLPKAKPELVAQNIVVSTTNGTRQRASPLTSQPSNSRSELSSVRTTKTNSVPTKPAVTRTQPSSSTMAPAQPRGSMTGARVTPNTSSAARTGNTAIKKSTAPANKTSSTVAGFCHECGCTFALASARFCSECGVRRLAL